MLQVKTGKLSKRETQKPPNPQVTTSVGELWVKFPYEEQESKPFICGFTKTRETKSRNPKFRVKPPAEAEY